VTSITTDIYFLVSSKIAHDFWLSIALIPAMSDAAIGMTRISNA